MNVWKIALTVVIVIFLVPLSAVEKTMPPPDPLVEQLMNLKNRLALDEFQTSKVREILEKEQVAASKDRDTFKGNALDLIKAATNRKKEKEDQIGTLLNSFQQEKFKEMVKWTRFDRDLFELTEGLVLNDEQAFTIEGILIDYYNKIKEIMPEEMWPGEGHEPNISIRVPKKRTGDRPELGPIRRMLKSLERKKNNSIRKVLTPGQKKLFEQVKKEAWKK